MPRLTQNLQSAPRGDMAPGPLGPLSPSPGTLGRADLCSALPPCYRETCAGGGSPWLSRGPWLPAINRKREMDFSANWAFHKQSEGPTRDGGSGAEPGLGFTAVYRIFLLSFPPQLGSSGFLFSRVRVGAKLSTVRWAAAIPNLMHRGCSCWSGIGAGSIPWVLCPAQPGCDVPASPLKSLPNLKPGSRRAPFALERIPLLHGVVALRPGPAVS